MIKAPQGAFCYLPNKPLQGYLLAQDDHVKDVVSAAPIRRNLHG